MDDARKTALKHRLYEIIFEAETTEGRAFDVALLVCIIASVAIVILESVHHIGIQYGALLRALEWIFTIIFTLEYTARIWAVKNRFRYLTSFYGVIDLLAILPTYLAIIFAGAQSLIGDSKSPADQNVPDI